MVMHITILMMRVMNTFSTGRSACPISPSTVFKVT